MKNRSRPPASGFSLAELLVVVAIIGIVSLYTIPNFVAMQRNGRLKNSLRLFTSDVRMMRQKAVTKHVQTKIGFYVGTTKNTYSMYEQSGSAWVQVGITKTFEKGCYFSNQLNFRTDRDAVADYDLIFNQDGTTTFDDGVFEGRVELSTIYDDLPVKTFRVSITKPGSVKSVQLLPAP
jgi:prepilin-type N-terminal cleavage/methylation domain-containing protein